MFVVLTALGGVAGAVYHSMFTALVQRSVAPEALGRVFSLYGSVAILPSLIGLTATGLIADYIGVTYAFVIAGAIIILIGVVAMFVKPVMRIGKMVS
jgi:DHA3 family macrolide efflux protein-like MFS transporter